MEQLRVYTDPTTHNPPPLITSSKPSISRLALTSSSSSLARLTSTNVFLAFIPPAAVGPVTLTLRAPNVLPLYAPLDDKDTGGIWMSATLLGEKDTPSASKGRGLILAFNLEEEGSVVFPSGDAGGRLCTELSVGVDGGEELDVRFILDLAKEIYEEREKGLNETLVGDGEGWGETEPGTAN